MAVVRVSVVVSILVSVAALASLGCGASDMSGSQDAAGMRDATQIPTPDASNRDVAPLDGAPGDAATIDSAIPDAAAIDANVDATIDADIDATLDASPDASPDAGTCDAGFSAPEICNGLDDNCNGMIDEGANSLCADDGLACSVELCAGVLGCLSAPAPGQCNIAGGCYADQTVNPLSKCQICAAAQSATSWSPNPAATCQIGGVCYLAGDRNGALGCQVCDPAQSTTAWSIPLNQCFIGGLCYASGAAAGAASFCQVCSPATSQTAFSPKPDTCRVGSTCYNRNDAAAGQFCQICSPPAGGTSTSLSLRANTCFIANSCYGAGATNGSLTCRVCDPSISTSSFNTTAGTCFINNACYANNQTNAGQTCQRCLASQSQSQFTNMPGTTICNTGDACYNDSYCSSGSCPARALTQDGNENNDTYTSATLFAPAVNECDAPQASGSGRLSGSADPDWYRVNFTENTINCTVDPALSVNSNAANVRACTFFRCINGNNEGINCQDGSSVDGSMSSVGYQGCCKSGINPTFRPAHDCIQPCSGFLCIPGDDDSADVRIRIDQLGATMCSDFSWSMHF